MENEREYVTRDETIAKIRSALKRRSGKPWSVTGGRGTAYGWIRIETPPRRRTWLSRPRADVPETGRSSADYEEYDSGLPGGHMGPAERQELADLLGLDYPCQRQGHSVPDTSKHYQEYIDRAEGREPSVIGERYWD